MILNSTDEAKPSHVKSIAPSDSSCEEQFQAAGSAIIASSPKDGQAQGGTNSCATTQPGKASRTTADSCSFGPTAYGALITSLTVLVHGMFEIFNIVMQAGLRSSPSSCSVSDPLSLMSMSTGIRDLEGACRCCLSVRLRELYT